MGQGEGSGVGGFKGGQGGRDGAGVAAESESEEGRVLVLEDGERELDGGTWASHP